MKRTHAQIGKLSRAKGRAFEQQVAVAFREIFPGARRHLENHKDDAAKGIDLINTGMYFVQCKKLRAYAPISRIEEVQCNRMLGEVPMLVTAGDRSEAMAVLPLSEFLALLKRLA